MGERRWADLRGTLDRLHDWPGEYTFKFILPTAKLEEFRAAVAPMEFSARYSKNGRYVSLTATEWFTSSETVIGVYRSLEGIEGLVSL